MWLGVAATLIKGREFMMLWNVRMISNLRRKKKLKRQIL
jgi:hypothetical protein